MDSKSRPIFQVHCKDTLAFFPFENRAGKSWKPWEKLGIDSFLLFFLSNFRDPGVKLGGLQVVSGPSVSEAPKVTPTSSAGPNGASFHVLKVRFLNSAHSPSFDL